MSCNFPFILVVPDYMSLPVKWVTTYSSVVFKTTMENMAYVDYANIMSTI